MAKSLVPCPSCARHVFANEQACPFCKSALPSTLADAIVPGTTQRLSRAAAFAFTASLAVTGCGGSTTTPPSDGTDSGSTGGQDGATDAQEDMGTGVALYGAPAYGLPPPPHYRDAGPDADSGPPIAL